jgi:galactokinase
MTGAGFGGCAIALVQKKEIELFKAIVSTQYKTTTSIDCEIYVSEIGDGVRKIID